MTKRITALALVLMMCLSLLPAPALAEETHTVTVVYEMPEACETPPPAQYTFTGEEGEPYSVTSPQVSGFAPDMPMVYGLVGDQDETITVHYNPIMQVVYVKFNVPEGYTAPKSQHKTGSPGMKYSFAVPEIANLTPDREKVEGEFGAQDETIEVTYYEDKHTATVKYTLPEGYTTPPDGRAAGLKGAEYNIESPAIAGLKPDRAAVTGTFASEDVTETVTYTEGDHTVTVKYTVPAGYEAQKPNDRALTAASGTDYSFTSPQITNLIVDKATVAGKVGHTDETITVTYAETGHTVTIDFIVPEGYSRPKPFVMTRPAGSAYSYQAPELDGLEASPKEVSGTVGTTDSTVWITYTPTQYHTVTVRYVNEFGEEMYTPRVKQGLKWGDTYSFNYIATAGFRPDKYTISGTMADLDLMETFTYSHVTTNTEWQNGSGGCTHPSDKIEEYNPSYDGLHYHMVEQNCRQCGAYRNVYRIPCTDTHGGGYPPAPDPDGFCDYCGQSMGERDDGYTLTVNYVVPEGYEAPPSVSKRSYSGGEYFFVSPTVSGLVPDQAIVQGNFSSNKTITVTYYEVHRLTIHYVLPDGYLKSRSYDDVLLYKSGERYQVSSPSFSDLAANPGVVIGTMGSQDAEATVEYYYNQTTLASFYLTINYVVPEGFTAPDQYRTQVEAGGNYNIPTPAVERLVPSLAAVKGTMGNADATVTVTYRKTASRLTINYNAPAGETKPDSYVADIQPGDEYVVRSPRITGYTASPFAVAGTMGEQDVTVEVNYNANPVVDASYKLTVNYTVPEAFQAVKPAAYRGLYSQGQAYDIQSPAVDGLVPSLEKVEGTMPRDDLTVEVVYRPADETYYYVTIHYVVPQGYAKPKDVVMTGVPGTPFCFVSPVLAELAPDQEKVEGTVTNEDQEFTVTYQRVYLVWITYKVPEGFVAPAPVFYRAPTGYQYRHVSPIVDGLTLMFPSTEKVIEGTVGTEDVFAQVRYSPGVALKIFYLYDGIHSTTKGDGTIQMPEPYVETFPLADGVEFDYSVDSPEFEKLRADRLIVLGKISNENVTEYVHYYDLEPHTVTFYCVTSEAYRWPVPGPVKIEVLEGDRYEYTPVELPGLRPKQGKYTGVMGKNNINVFIFYEMVSGYVPVSEGDGQTVNKASDGAGFRMDKDHDSFSGKAWGDGKPLQRGTDYTDRSGSTVIELTESYLSTLLPGSHELAVRFDDSDAVMSFTTTYNTFGPATFTLPSELRTIEAGAFEGDASITVVDAHACTAIGADAFNGCTGLTQIRLPINCTIGDRAFDGCTSLLAIYGTAGGSTETWANSNHIPFVAE